MKFHKKTRMEEPSPECLLLITSLALIKLLLFKQPEFASFSGVAFLISTDRLMRKMTVKTNGQQTYWKKKKKVFNFKQNYRSFSHRPSKKIVKITNEIYHEIWQLNLKDELYLNFWISFTSLNSPQLKNLNQIIRQLKCLPGLNEF